VRRANHFTGVAAGLLLLGGAALAQTGASSYERTLLAIQEQIQNRNFAAAEALATQAERAFPANGGIENLKGVIAIQQGRAEEAERDFVAAVRHSPRLASAYLNLGRLYRENPGHDRDAEAKALRAYEKALTIAPENAEANYNVAGLLMHTGKYERSLEHRSKLSQEEQQSVGMLVVACADEAALGHKVDLERHAEALAAQADLAEADVIEAVPALRTARRADLIETLLSAAAAHQSLSAAGLRMLGLAEEAMGQLPRAQDALERAFAADSASVATLSDLARVAEERKDLKGALGYLAHARDLEPRNAEYSYQFGLICAKMSLLSEAHKALEEAVQMNPENPDYNYAMGVVTDSAKGPNDALPYLEKFHALRPADAKGILALGTTSYRAKDFDAASKWLKQAETHVETAAAAHFYLGRIARQRGQFDEAQDELVQADKLGPNQPEVLAETGQLYLQQKKYPDAEKALDRAAALDPESYAANFGLLQLYARTGDPRREEQSKRFDAIKAKNEEQYRETLRVLEIRPDGAKPDQP
jgi:tetratricopeptide (TPR) repeat protein